MKLLYNAIRSNKQIEIEQEEPEQEATNENDGTDITIDYVKEAKVKEMKTECNKMITNGFDVELSDNQSHHFFFNGTRPIEFNYFVSNGCRRSKNYSLSCRWGNCANIILPKIWKRLLPRQMLSKHTMLRILIR